jgi:hypothetical protein
MNALTAVRMVSGRPFATDLATSIHAASRTSPMRMITTVRMARSPKYLSTQFTHRDPETCLD